MTDHRRQQVRDAIVAAVTGLATTGARVYRSRQYPLDRGGLPGLLVYTLRERAEALSLANGLLRTLDVAVVAVDEATADLDDRLDAIAAEVEAALGRSALGGLVWAPLGLVETEIMLTAEGAKPCGAAVMTWRAMYSTLENDATIGA